MTARAVALAVLGDIAEPELVAKVAELEAAGTHHWVFDQEVDGVVGFMRAGTNRADLVVYLEEADFEGDLGL